MKNNIRAEFKPDSVDMVNFFMKHMRLFIIAGFAVAVVTAIISLMIKPLYESTVILYPSSNIIQTQAMLGEMTPESELFGDEEATEKLLQIIKSEQLREYLKEKYDLTAHYNIGPGEKYPNTLIAQKMKKYIKSAKTSFGSVEIRVRDRDRELACRMANDIAMRTDTIFNNMQRKVSAGMISEINKIYEMQLNIVRQYEDSLMIATGPRSLTLYSSLESETENLELIRARYLEAQALSRQSLPYTVVVDNAVVAEKKVYPKRSLIVIITTASLLLLLALTLFISEGVKLHRTDDRL